MVNPKTTCKQSGCGYCQEYYCASQDHVTCGGEGCSSSSWVFTGHAKSGGGAGELVGTITLKLQTRFFLLQLQLISFEWWAVAVDWDEADVLRNLFGTRQMPNLGHGQFRMVRVFTVLKVALLANVGMPVWTETGRSRFLHSQFAEILPLTDAQRKLKMVSAN